MKFRSFELFSSITTKERSSLENFIKLQGNSKMFEHIGLYEVYKTALERNLIYSKEEIFNKIFQKQKFQDAKLRLLQSDFSKILEKYIIYLSLDENTDYHKKVLLEHMKTTGLKSQFVKQLRRFAKNEGVLNLETIDEDLFIAEELYENAIQNREEGKDVTQRLLDKLDLQYILKKLRYSCLVRSQENVYNFNFEHGLLDHVLASVEDNSLYDIPAIGIYYYCYRMLAAKSKNADFDQFYNYLQKHNDQFSKKVNAELYTLAINFCIRSLNQGNKDFGRTGLLFYTDGIDKGILLTNGRISRFTFRNIVTMAIRIDEFDEAENFIEKYKHLLSKEDQMNMVYFTMALVFFSRGKYDEASDALLKVKFKDLLFNLASKGLQLKIYYDTNEFMVLGSHLDAMQIFLKRHQSLGYHKQNYLNVISLTRKLMNAKSVEKVKKLANIIAEEKTLTERIWFIQKVKELGEKFAVVV